MDVCLFFVAMGDIWYINVAHDWLDHRRSVSQPSGVCPKKTEVNPDPWDPSDPLPLLDGSFGTIHHSLVPGGRAEVLLMRLLSPVLHSWKRALPAGDMKSTSGTVS